MLRKVQIREGKRWSGRKDLNLRPPGPEPGALARLRYAPNLSSYFLTVYAGLHASATITLQALQALQAWKHWKQKQSRREVSAARRLFEDCYLDLEFVA